MKSEFERIQTILSQVQCSSPDLLLGAGDDAAVFKSATSNVVVSTDAVVENVHFRRDWIQKGWASWADLGKRAVYCSLSDLAAMGARPRWVLVSLILPIGFEDDALEEWMKGVVSGARDVGAEVIGGNLAKGEQFSSTMTVVGETKGKVLARSGAQPGDGIYVTGEIGSAALGLEILLREDVSAKRTAAEKVFVKRFLLPPVEKTFLLEIEQAASACLDISDGLLQDLTHLCKQSDVGAEIRMDTIPTSAHFHNVARRLGLDSVKLILSGGEDYELLFTSSNFQAAAKLGKKIGEITGEKTIRIFNEGGKLIDFKEGGFDHFKKT